MNKTTSQEKHGGVESPTSSAQTGPYIIKKITPGVNLTLQRRNSKEGLSNNPLNQLLKQKGAQGEHPQIPNFARFTKKGKHSPKIMNVD